MTTQAKTQRRLGVALRISLEGEAVTEKTKDDEIFELSEKVRALNVDLNTYRAESIQMKLAAQSVVRKLLSRCPACRKKMLTIDWSTTACIFTCDNERCDKYRQPAGTLSKENLEILGISLKLT